MHPTPHPIITSLECHNQDEGYSDARGHAGKRLQPSRLCFAAASTPFQNKGYKQ